MIEIKNLSKKYGENEILKNINLTINSGEIFGLVGASGAGKSTILNCINGIDEYQNGSILVDGIQIESLSTSELREMRKNIGVIFQNASLLKRKDVFQNISLPLECWGYDRAFIKDRVYKLAEMVGIENKLNSRPDELSGGQRQRVCIARALALEPKYLLSDESTSALDPKTTLSILELIKQIHKEIGLTVVFVTHEMQVIQNICERMAILEDGNISDCGYVTEMFLNKPKSLQRLLGKEEIELPEEGVNLSFNLLSDTVNMPILCDLVKISENKISIVDAKFYNSISGKICNITINLVKEDLCVTTNYLKSKNILFKIIENGGR